MVNVEPARVYIFVLPGPVKIIHPLILEQFLIDSPLCDNVGSDTRSVDQLGIYPVAGQGKKIGAVMGDFNHD